MIKIKYESGSTSMVSTACHGLMYWLLEQSHLFSEESLEEILSYGKVKLFKSNVRVISQDDPGLFIAVIGAIERRWDKTPDPNLLLATKTLGERETCALYLLQWLHEHGDIASLDFDVQP